MSRCNVFILTVKIFCEKEKKLIKITIIDQSDLLIHGWGWFEYYLDQRRITTSCMAAFFFFFFFSWQCRNVLNCFSLLTCMSHVWLPCITSSLHVLLNSHDISVYVCVCVSRFEIQSIFWRFVVFFGFGVKCEISMNWYKRSFEATSVQFAVFFLSGKCENRMLRTVN